MVVWTLLRRAVRGRAILVLFAAFRLLRWGEGDIGAAALDVEGRSTLRGERRVRMDRIASRCRLFLWSRAMCFVLLCPACVGNETLQSPPPTSGEDFAIVTAAPVENDEGFFAQQRWGDATMEETLQEDDASAGAKNAGAGASALRRRRLQCGQLCNEYTASVCEAPCGRCDTGRQQCVAPSGGNNGGGDRAACGIPCTHDNQCWADCRQCDHISRQCIIPGGDFNRGCGSPCSFHADCQNSGTCSLCDRNRRICIESNPGCGSPCTFDTDCRGSGSCSRCDPNGRICVDPNSGGGGGGGCINNYNSLRDRLQRSQFGETINLCQGTIFANNNNPLVVNAAEVTMRCRGPGMCIIDKQNRPNRILNWNGRQATIIGIEFRNARNNGGNGGAIAISGSGNNVINGCTFRRNSGRLGGAIYANWNGNLIIQNAQFVENNADVGGAAYVETGNRIGAISNDGSLNRATRCNGIWYESTQDCRSVNGDSGGGNCNNCVRDEFDLRNRIQNSGVQTISICAGQQIVVNAEIQITRSNLFINCCGGQCNLRGSNSRIFNVVGDSNQFHGLRFTSGNAANGNGGAMTISGYNTEIQDCVFQDNSAENGGAIYADFGRQPRILVSTFTRNTASSRGGAVMVNDQQPVAYVSSDASRTNAGSANSANQCNDIYNDATGLCTPFTSSTFRSFGDDPKAHARVIPYSEDEEAWAQPASSDP